MTDEQKFNHKGKTFGLRHLLCFFIFLGLAVAHSLRVNLSVAIVAMTDENANPEYDLSMGYKNKITCSEQLFLGICPHIDLSPNFAGTLMGMTNCASNLMSILAPLAVGFIVSDEKNPEQWKIIFFITAGFFFIGNLMFICFGKTNTQYWNDPQPVIVKTFNNKSQHLVYQDTVDKTTGDLV